MPQILWPTIPARGRAARSNCSGASGLAGDLANIARDDADVGKVALGQAGQSRDGLALTASDTDTLDDGNEQHGSSFRLWRTG